MGYLLSQWSLRWQRKYPQMKSKKKLSRNFLVMCEFISQSYTYVSWSSPLILSLRNLRRASLDRIEADADKGNFIRSKRERSFLRNVFLICEFISQTYNLDYRKQFANTVFVDSAKGYLGAHWAPWWKSKYPQIKTGKKPSEKLDFHEWMKLTELHVSLQWSVC